LEFLIDRRHFLLVYNGAEYFDTSHSLVSETFNSIVVHLTLRICVEWSLSVENNRERDVAEQERKDQDKRAEQERKRVSKVVRGLKALGYSTICT